MQAAFKNNLAVESLQFSSSSWHVHVTSNTRTESALTAVSKVFADNLSSLYQGAYLGQPTRKWWKVPCRAFQTSTKAQPYLIHADKKLVLLEGDRQSSFHWLQQDENNKIQKRSNFPKLNIGAGMERNQMSASHFHKVSDSLSQQQWVTPCSSPHLYFCLFSYWLHSCHSQNPSSWAHCPSVSPHILLLSAAFP